MLYKVDFKPEEGRSDLTILRAEYEKDNSKFECRFKDMSSGTYTVISLFTVTVLSEYFFYLLIVIYVFFLPISSLYLAVIYYTHIIVYNNCNR